MRTRGVVLILAVVAGLLGPAATVHAAPPSGYEAAALRAKAWPADAVEGSLLVTTVDARTAAAVGDRSFGRVAHVEVAPGTEAATAAELRRRRGVVAVEPDRWRPLLRTPNDPEQGQQLSHTIGRTVGAWDVTTGSPSIRVAVIDSGVDGTHPDLRPNLVSQWDASSGDVEARPLGTDNDACGVGHGTMVAGIIGAVGDNQREVAGVAWQVGLVDIAAADPTRCAFSDAVVVAAIDHARSLGVQVINLSLGGPGDTCPTAVHTAIGDARRSGAAVVAAAGNHELDLPGVPAVPASCDGVIGVGAVGRTGARAAYSVRNAWVDVVAAGGDPSLDAGILSTGLGGGTTRDYGTSFAAPYVAGVAALLLAVDPSLSPNGIEAHLEASTGRSSRSTELGWGIVRADRAVSAAAGGPAPTLRGGEPSFPVGLVSRIGPVSGPTDAVRQAAALSQRVFGPEAAQHVVLARADDYADALAGSSLGFGTGPVLFTGSTGPVAEPTMREIQRVLSRGGLVYVLGGTGAVPPTAESELTAAGYDVRRLAGPTREGTAAAVAEEIPRRIEALYGGGFPAPDRAILVTARNWPDAVTAGALGAFFGYPILLTPPGELHPATRWALGRMRPAHLYVVGGTAAVTSPTAADAHRTAGGSASRHAGTDRFGTAAAVVSAATAHTRQRLGIDPQYAVAVNLRRADAFAHVLSASVIPGAGTGVFVAVEGEGGDRLPLSSAGVACRADDAVGFVAGGLDIVTQAVQAEFNRLLENGC